MFLDQINVAVKKQELASGEAEFLQAFYESLTEEQRVNLDKSLEERADLFLFICENVVKKFLAAHSGDPARWQAVIQEELDQIAKMK